jgi:hypothetical protein
MEISTCHGIRIEGLTNPFIALGESDLTGVDNDLPSSVITSNAGDQLDVFDERGAGKADDLADICFVCYANRDASTADIFNSVGDKFRDEDVVVRTVAD